MNYKEGLTEFSFDLHPEPDAKIPILIDWPFSISQNSIIDWLNKGLD